MIQEARIGADRSWRFVSEIVCAHDLEVLSECRARVVADLNDSVADPMDEPFDYVVSDTDAAWAAGLFAGEGYCGVHRRRDLFYVHISMQMLDERSIHRFARMFERRVGAYPLAYDKTRLRFVVRASGRAAEGILRVMWPHITGTDKGDQIRAACLRTGVLGWVDGTATMIRPVRRERGRAAMSPQTKERIAAGHRARTERRRNNRG